ncbi:hypothetical protein, partial [Haloquadratum walsbyi]|uniref:hypothetical protein n=1 Tax=Haloquadratum walsbyi TaxID=293091 RepID=UPI0023F44D35
ENPCGVHELSRVELLEVPSLRFFYPQLNRNSWVVFATSSSVSLTRLGVTFCAVFKQSGTASIHEMNRPFI